MRLATIAADLTAIADNMDNGGIGILNQTTIFRRAASVLQALDELRNEEGESVELINDNPDFGGPNCAVNWTHDWGVTRMFNGEDLMECLRKALEYKRHLSRRPKK